MISVICFLIATVAKRWRRKWTQKIVGYGSPVLYFYPTHNYNSPFYFCFLSLFFLSLFLSKGSVHDSSSGVEDTVLTLKINPGTNFGTLIKPMFSIFDVIIFRFNNIIKQPALFLAIAEVYKTEGNEACLKEDYSNAVYFYTEGLKANCKDEGLAVSFYSKYSSIQCA